MISCTSDTTGYSRLKNNLNVSEFDIEAKMMKQMVILEHQMLLLV